MRKNVALFSFSYYFKKSNNLRTHKIRTQTLILALDIAHLLNLVSGKKTSDLFVFNSALAAVNATGLKLVKSFFARGNNIEKGINCAHRCQCHLLEVWSTNLYNVAISTANTHLCIKLSTWAKKSCLRFSCPHLFFHFEIWHLWYGLLLLLFKKKLCYMLI